MKDNDLPEGEPVNPTNKTIVISAQRAAIEESQETARMSQEELQARREIAESQIAPVFGYFRVLKHLGSGGMGDVNLVIYDPELLRSRIKQEFETEFQAPETSDLDSLETLIESNELELDEKQERQLRTRMASLKKEREELKKIEWQADIEVRTEEEYQKRVDKIVANLNSVFDRCPDLIRVYELTEDLTADDLPNLQFAMKTLKPELTTDIEILTRFKEEGNVLSAGGKLGKEVGIIKVFEAGEFNDTPYLVIEYLPGQIPEGKLDRKVALFITKAVASSLYFSHQNGVVHRDLKPENIRLRKPAGEPISEEEVVVTDFGIVKDQSRQTLTMQGTAVGTVEYMSPEQAAGSPVDGRSDIYSLGVMLYEFLTGSKMAYETRFKTENEPQGTVEKRQADILALLGPIADVNADISFYPRELNPEIPKPLENIVLKMVEKDPAKRYQTMAEVREDIERFEQGKKITAPCYDWRRFKRKIRMHQKKAIAAAVLSLALSAGGVLGYRYSRTLEYLINRMPAAEAGHDDMNDFSDRLLERTYTRKIDPLIRKMPSNLFPLGIEFGLNEWETAQGKYATSGHWTHILWTAYEETGEEHYRKAAEQWTRQLNLSNFRRIDELASFIFNSYVIGYEATENEEFKNIALDAAEKLALAYDEESGFIQVQESGEHGDILHSITLGRIAPLLLWASENAETQDERDRYKNVILEHAHSTARYCIREDGSTRECSGIDPETKQLRADAAIYGYRQKRGGRIETCHSASHANAMFGFTHLYEITEQEEFLRTAERLADFYLDNVPKETARAEVDGEETFAAIAYVPFYDFRDPRIEDNPESVPKDSRAASIAALSLFNLSELEPDIEKARIYRKAAYDILRSLHQNCFVSDENHQGVLNYATGNANTEGFVNGSLISGDDAYLSLMAKLER